MNDKFPSIWLEYTDLQGQKMIIGGFYREWDRNGKASIEAQATRIEILANHLKKIIGLLKFMLYVCMYVFY